MLVERLPDGKLPVDVAVVHIEDGVEPGDRDLVHVAHGPVEPAGPNVDVVVDELEVEIAGGVERLR